jgi:hypothetical protein
LAFIIVEIVHADDPDSVLFELRKQYVAQTLPLLLDQVGDARVDRIQLLRLGDAVWGRLTDVRSDLTSQTRNPDHIELVQIGAEDRQKLYTFEQAVARVERLVKNTGVELEPAKLAIDVKRWVKAHCVELRSVKAKSPFNGDGRKCEIKFP